MQDIEITRAEPWAENCQIPQEFRLYHGGRPIKGVLVARRCCQRTSGPYVFFSVDREYVQTRYVDQEYIPDPERRDGASRLYVIDARHLPSDSLVVRADEKGGEGVWKDHIRALRTLLRWLNQEKVKTVNELRKRRADFVQYDTIGEYLWNHPQANTRRELFNLLQQERRTWLKQYCVPFSIENLASYQDAEENDVLVRGPIPVKE